MPGRKVPLVTGEVYHVFNRGINRQPIFTAKKEYQRAIDAIAFYRYHHPPVRLSMYLHLEAKRQAQILQRMEQTKKIIDLFAFCLMPNHFHFLIRQKTDNGISKFLGNFQNSYTRYFNTRHKRDGALLLDQFKAVHIETDEQLLHVCRYIHLNPYIGYLVKTLEELEEYSWSSLIDYLDKDRGLGETGYIIEMFKNVKDFRKFIFDQADFQRNLKHIEHLVLE